MMFMISMNVIVSMGSILVCSTAIRSAYDHALRMLGYPRKRAMILTYKGSLKTMTPIRASPPVAPAALGMGILGTVHNGHSPPTAPWRGLRAAGLHICGEARYWRPPLPCLWKPL